MIEFKLIDTRDTMYNDELALRYELLRKPLGMPRGSEVFPFENKSLHLVAMERGKVIGCVLFKREKNTGRLFAMAVAEKFQGKGIGRRLVSELEKHLITEGVQEIYLHARAHVTDFYKTLGYSIRGEPFIEVGIKHFLMKKIFEKSNIPLNLSKSNSSNKNTL